VILRFDDICVNTRMRHANELAEMWRRETLGDVWYCISPLVDASNDERVFPAIYKAMSDYRKFYGVNTCGIPDVPDWVTVCSHGLVHVDHRLIGRDAQEMSILVSCNLLRSRIFVPPFNKYDSNMIDICRTNGIHLVCFEDGWRSIEHERYSPSVLNWYLHSRNVTGEQMGAWLASTRN
jgi:hypothetical protein